MKTILFVDDAPEILAGFRNALRSERTVWRMLFALGGEEALGIVDSTPLDVVVTDMRMPKVDGVQVLEHTRRAQPRAVRIVLSGHAENASEARAMFAAQQVLAKPCDAGTLRETIRRACLLQDLAATETIRTAVGALAAVPPSLATYSRLRSALRDPRTSSEDVARLLESDVAMAAKVLEVANSALFGFPRRISSVAEAATSVGFSAITNLTLGLASMSAFSDRAAHRTISAVERHCLLTARIAQGLVGDDPVARETAFVGGLLHDIGLLIPGLDGQDPAEHGAAGGYLLGLWGLPADVIECVAKHADAAAGPPAARPSPIDAVRAASALASDSACDDNLPLDAEAPPGTVASFDGEEREAARRLARALAEQADALPR